MNFEPPSINEIILTPNRRLAATLIKQHCQLQINQHKQCWLTPNILPLTSWLETLWHEYTSHTMEKTPLLLTSFQELVLWEEIIKQSPQSELLLQVSSTAKLVSSAWDLLKQWKINLNRPELATTDDSQLFQQWAKQFQKRCKQKNYLDRASLADFISELIINKKISITSEIRLVGFIEVSPQIQALLSLTPSPTETQPTLSSPRRRGSTLRNPDSLLEMDPRLREDDTGHSSIYSTTSLAGEAKTTAFQVELTDKDHEITTMARWAKNLYDTHPTPPQIACIVPDLENCRADILRIFREVFGTHTLEATPFNISAGRKLIDCPIIHTAIQLLSLSDQISFEKLSHLLRSPFLIQAETEASKRALYENYLRRLNINTFVFSESDSLKFSSYSPSLSKRIKTYLTNLTTIKKQLNPSKWVIFFNDALSLLGWPGERSLNSEELQIIQNGWLPLLNEFSKLDNVIPTLNHQQACHYLIQFANQIVFQPQTPDTPIQLLGILEAAGLSFDYGWVMGLDDSTWPAQPSPNPFIPLRLQKQLNMPNASADREFNYCQTLTENFTQSISHIYFSYALQNEKSIQRPSSLIKFLPKAHLNELNLSKFESINQVIFAQKQLEYIDDFMGPSIQQHELIQGGSYLFKLQAACPFKAFAELRLHADELTSPIIGLRPQERGKLLHTVLELFWKEHITSDQLNLLTETQLQESISQCVATAFKQRKLTRYLSIEKKRLEKIIALWLTLEKNRPSFKVLACEQNLTTQVGKIPINLRIDRIDQLSENEYLIIDYKSSKNNSIQSWFGERLDEPQLPLYCTINATQTIGISFAEIASDALQFKGVSKHTLDIPAIKPLSEIKNNIATSWDNQIAQWQTTLEQLSEHFYQGTAHVDPKHDETCRHCSLQSLCRVGE